MVLLLRNGLEQKIALYKSPEQCRKCFLQCTMHNIIPLILIVRNQKLFHFFEAQILTILRLCKFKKNQIEPMIELNVM